MEFFYSLTAAFDSLFVHFINNDMQLRDLIAPLMGMNESKLDFNKLDSKQLAFF